MENNRVFEKYGYEDVQSIQLVQGSAKKWAFVNTVMKLYVQ
jgi:hypothetical protein